MRRTRVGLAVFAQPYMRLGSLLLLLGLASLLAVLCSCGGASAAPPSKPTPPSTPTPPTTNFQLTVSFSGTGTGAIVSTPAGISCHTGSTTGCSTSLPSGTSVTLAVTPDTSMVFAGWQGGGCSGTNPSCTFTLTANTNIAVTLNPAPPPPPPPPPPPNFQLTIAFAGNGTGAVVSTPSGISCRTGTSNAGCSASYASGTSVQLAVTPDPSMVLAGWQGGGCSGTAPTCTVTVTADTTVTVTLNPAPPPPPANAQLTVTESGGGQGTVVSSPKGISCPGTCTASFSQGTQITLTATAASGSTFGGYSGACVSQGAKAKDANVRGHATPPPPTCTFTANGTQSVTAVFTTVQPPPPPPPTSSLAVTISGEGSVTSSPAGIDCPTTCSAIFAQGTVVTLTAHNTVRVWYFNNWSGLCNGLNGPCQVTITSTNQSITAVFLTPDLVYHGGPVMPTTTTKAIFWGPKWTDSTFVGDKITGVDAWYQGVSGSSYAGSVDEYTDSSGQHVTAASTYTGHIIDSSPDSDSGAIGEACKLVPNPVPDEYVAVYLDQPRPGNSCAYHTYYFCGPNSTQEIIVSVFYNLDNDPGCNPNDNSTGHSQGLASLGNMNGHEFSEARTDPHLTSWIDSNGEETGDKCDWIFTDPSVTFSDGTKWKIQANWSNYAYDNALSQSGCVDYNVTGQ